MIIKYLILIEEVSAQVLVDSFSMSEPAPSKRTRAGNSTLATETSSTTDNNLAILQLPTGPFREYFHKFESVDKRTRDLLSVYANGRAIKQLSQPIGHPQQAWLDIVDTYIMENETDSDCDDGDFVPQVVDGVHDIESDDESL